MRNALAVIGSFLMKLLGTEAVKILIVKKLKTYAASTDNEIDDTAVRLVESALNNEKNIDALKELYTKWSGKTIDDAVSES
jgi:hypothetical protein